ncbi:Prefoldin [Coniochaeta sp. 2T2.1]|nr:Prefoldin [Coniochaeta sp. 2T2.1]
MPLTTPNTKHQTIIKLPAKPIATHRIPHTPSFSASNQTNLLKMSISNEALGKLLREIEAQSVATQQQISLVRTQMGAKQREMRLAQLTRSEISSLPADTGVYEGVGKMFVQIPVPSLQTKLEGQMKDMQTEVESMGKRLHYLETTAKNSQEHINKMLQGAGQA